jgi:hypothetical protein
MTDPQLARFRNDLATIADAYALLAAQHREQIRDERTKPDHSRGRDDYGQPTGGMAVADPIAHAMPSGPAKQASKAPMVSGSHEAPVPVSLDLVDLTSEARHGSMYVADSSPWPEDQVGHIAVATELDFWVRDIADVIGDPLPVPVVPVLAMWLHERAGWAWDYYGALDEMVVTVDRISRTLYAIVNPRGPRPERKAAPCPGCGEATLCGDGERVWCEVDDCGRVLTAVEYGQWAAAEAHRELSGGVGISAKAIALRWNRPVGTVRYWAHQYQWPRSGGEQRPVLYLVSAVEATMAGILEREAAEREASAA